MKMTILYIEDNTVPGQVAVCMLPIVLHLHARHEIETSLGYPDYHKFLESLVQTSGMKK